MAEKEDKLTRLRAKLAEKEASLENCDKKIESAKAEIKTLKAEIQKLNAQISAAELESLGDMLRKNGVSLEDIFSAVERGDFTKTGAAAENTGNTDTPENLNIPQHSSEKGEGNENCAIYSTKESEVSDAISDS